MKKQAQFVVRSYQVRGNHALYAARMHLRSGRRLLTTVQLLPFRLYSLLCLRWILKRCCSTSRHQPLPARLT